MNEQNGNGTKSDIRHLEEDVKELFKLVGSLQRDGCGYRIVNEREVQRMNQQLLILQKNMEETTKELSRTNNRLAWIVGLGFGIQLTLTILSMVGVF